MFKPTTYKYSIAFGGNPNAALHVARSALLALGFDILDDADSRLKAEGPGMTHNKQPPLTGVSLLNLEVTASQINATAILGGVANMKAFIYLFPPLLAIALMIFFFFFSGTKSWYVLLTVAPWIVVAPIMASSLEKKVAGAVDRLVRGMAQARQSVS